jgi:hypothetical protein
MIGSLWSVESAAAKLDLSSSAGSPRLHGEHIIHAKERITRRRDIPNREIGSIPPLLIGGMMASGCHFPAIFQKTADAE